MKVTLYGGSSEYGRPMKGHGWHPMTYPEMGRRPAVEIAGYTSAAEDDSLWRYDRKAVTHGMETFGCFQESPFLRFCERRVSL